MTQNKPEQNTSESSTAPDGAAANEIVQKVDQQQLQHFVTTIKSAEQQVGENIIGALSHDNTVAVLTTVVMGPQGQQILSAALDPKMMSQVQQILMAAQQSREKEEKCIGFHCLIKPKGESSADG